MEISDVIEAGLIVGWFLAIIWLCWFCIQFAFGLLGFNIGGMYGDDDFWSITTAISTWIAVGILYGLFVWIF